MVDVVVIGGGLAGLVALRHLEAHGQTCTLIEVKRQLGGSLRTVEESGWIVDAGPMAFAPLPAEALEGLGLPSLTDELFHMMPDALAWRRGAGQLVSALSQGLRTSRMMRMAVSSVGLIEDGLVGICLENGVLLTARAVIIAAPARWAARMVMNERPEMAGLLADFHYDSLLRLSLGYRKADVPEQGTPPQDLAYVYQYHLDHPDRVPPEHVLWQIGVRLGAEQPDPRQVMQSVVTHWGLPAPVYHYAGHWPESDLLSSHDDEHPAHIAQIMADLPPYLALAGSDYLPMSAIHQGIVDLHVRLAQARTAAERIVTYLKG